MENIDDYLKVNLTDRQAINLIKSKIEQGDPFSFTRFGDGEIAILTKNQFSQLDAFKKRFCRNWNYKFPDEIELGFQQASEVMINAFKGSDLIGLMNPNSKTVRVNDYSAKNWSILESTVKSWGIDTDALQICDHMLCRSIDMGSVDSMREILNGRSVNIISPNVTRLALKNLSEKLDTNVTFTNHPNTINFKNREEFIKSLKNIESDVVLFGTGLQKDYGVILKELYGKITIDMGATLDAWSGITSRQWFRPGGGQDHLVL